MTTTKPRDFWIEMSKYDEPRTVWTDDEMSRFLEVEDILGLQKRSIKVISYEAYQALERKLEEMKEHLKLALSFCPKGEVPKDLAPMFYHTLNYEDEVQLQKRIDAAREALKEIEGEG